MLILWIVWAGVTAILLALLAYRGTINRDEEDQPDRAVSEANHPEQQWVLQRIQPFVNIMTGATCLLSATLIAACVWDAVHQLR